jgi:hypothetical protein
VIVGDITGPANYSAINGVEALSLGTTSCNQGTAGVGWHSNTNQHPVIGGELYKFKVVNGAGHFEQIGLSWLKHGFYAESQTLCCNNCQGTNGTTLGVGCSDPYTASRNGTQSLMGPRYQVNANTGYFTYPPPRPSGGNTGRIEVLVSDLEVSNPSGTRYFGNAQYIAPDDAVARHGNNNCSYREITVTGSGTAWTFSFTGTTHREIPAIQAWATCESGVTLQNIQIPNEGLLILGYKTTSLGGGQYHYEYALYNMNSDDSVGSFSLPVPAGVALTNIGFHDVTYRGGDGNGGVNYDGTDWPATNSGGTLSWATSTFAQNANANAIRWGTTYTFRFDANAPPTAGTLTIGQFKSGGSLTAPIEVPSGEVTSPYCFGDGSSAACPCANSGAAGHGCQNSSLTGGALLTSAGTPSLSADTLALTCSGERPTAFSIVLQGNAAISPVDYGDGLRCVGGSLKRLYSRNAVGGVITAPQGADPSISAQSAAHGDVLSAGETRFYQIYYRDPDVSFCPSPMGDTWNIGNAMSVAWSP